MQVEDVKGEDCYTSFYGMDMTRDKLCFIVNKWQSTIEAHVDVKTKDGYLIRLFAIGFTNRRKSQLKATCYASTTQRKEVRDKMRQLMINEASQSTLKELAVKFIDKTIETKIASQCNKIFPLKDVYIRKMKMVKKPKFDQAKFMDLYSDKPAQNAGPGKKEEGEGNLLEQQE